MTAADTTTPWRAKAARRLSLEVVKDRPPTSSFTDMGALLLNPHGLWRAQDVSCDLSAGPPLLMNIPSPRRVRGPSRHPPDQAFRTAIVMAVNLAFDLCLHGRATSLPPNTTMPSPPGKFSIL